MKILNVIQAYPPVLGGTELYCRTLCQLLSKKGVVTEVAAINLNKMDEFHLGVKQDEIYSRLGKYAFDNSTFITRYDLWSLASERPSAKIIKFMLGRFGLEKTELGSIFKHSPHSFEMYTRLFSKINDADIVHLHTLPFFHNIVGYCISKLLKKKVVINSYFHPGHIYYERKIFYKLLRGADAVVALSEFEKKYLMDRGVNGKNIFVSGFCLYEENKDTKISLSEADELHARLFVKYNVDEKLKKIIFIGKKSRYKGIDVLIKAARQAAIETGKDIYLFLVGEAAEEFDNQDCLSANGGKLFIIDFGVLAENEKVFLIQHSDVLVLLSQFESFGIVFLEAWKYKKPVIGSDAGSIPETIKGGGLVAKFGDVADLKEKLKKILSDKDFARKLGIAGKEKINKQFSEDTVIKNVFYAYSHVFGKRKRILFVSNLFPPFSSGGSEIVAYKHALLLKKRGYEIKVFAGKRVNGEKQYNMSREKGRLDVLRINLHDSDFDYRIVNVYRKQVIDEFRKAIHDFAPDLVHFHNIYSFALAMVDTCRDLHIPSVMTVHDYWGICLKNILVTDNGEICKKNGFDCPYCSLDLLGNNLGQQGVASRNKVFLERFNACSLLISPSEYLARRFIDAGVDKGKFKVINNGIDLSVFAHMKKNFSRVIRFGYIGQIIEHKGIPNLLKAFSILTEKEKKSVSLLIVGTGHAEYVDLIKKIVLEYGLKDTISFAGFIANNRMYKIYKRLDAVIIPSVWPENSPVVIMEALASGIPVLASDIGGIPEMVKNGVNGWLHKYDNPYNLAENIRKVIGNSNVMRQMKTACIETVKPYELSKQIAVMEDCYNKLIYQPASS